MEGTIHIEVGGDWFRLRLRPLAETVGRGFNSHRLHQFNTREIMETVNKTIVEQTIQNNGILPDSDEVVTHIVEYHEVINRFPTWKLCRDKTEYEACISNRSFINPFLMWVREVGE